MRSIYARLNRRYGTGQPVEQQSLLANFAVVHGGALKGHPAAFFTQTETLRCSEGNQYYGCMEGALQSGLKAGSAILRRI